MRAFLLRTVLPAAGFVLSVAACSIFSDSKFGDEGGGDPSSSGASSGSFGGGGDGGKPFVCSPDKNNAEIPDNGCDDDADGQIDNKPTPCDGSISGSSATDFARAIGVCDQAAGGKGYGLVKAEFTRGFGRNDAPQAEQHGVLPKFGNVVKPREGSKLGVLSTGYAREFNGPSGNEPFGGEAILGGGGVSYGKDWYNFGRPAPGKPGNGTLPPGFPKAASGCEQADTTNDVINLRLTIKAPPNATGIKFDFNFYSGEWPAYICSQFNDGFIAYLTSGGKGDNISFDSKKNPVSVNNGFFDRCTPSVETGCGEGAKKGTSECPGGPSELAGTGFGVSGKWCSVYQGGGNQTSVNGGATGWLTSQAPIVPGEEFTIEFLLWDTGDAILDSSVLIDNFTWASGQVTTSTGRPPK